MAVKRNNQRSTVRFFSAWTYHTKNTILMPAIVFNRNAILERYFNIFRHSATVRLSHRCMVAKADKYRKLAQLKFTLQGVKQYFEFEKSRSKLTMQANLYAIECFQYRCFNMWRDSLKFRKKIELDLRNASAFRNQATVYKILKIFSKNMRQSGRNERNEKRAKSKLSQTLCIKYFKNWHKRLIKTRISHNNDSIVTCFRYHIAIKIAWIKWEEVDCCF